MKKLNFILFLIVFLCPSVYSQFKPELANNTQKEKKQTPQNQNKLYFLSTESFPLEHKGKQFLNTKFIDGQIIDFDDEVISTPIRYRFVDDEMQIMHLSKIKALYPQKVKRIIFGAGSNGEKIFIPAEYMAKDVQVYGYFRLLSDGDISLLKAYRKNGKKGPKTQYYVLKKGELAQPIKVKKSQILKLFKSHKSDISKYMAINDLNVKNEKDLRQLFDYYNSLGGLF